MKGCDADFHLEIDHVVPISEGGLTNIPNLWRICWYHHRLKTNEGWKVTGDPHDWDLVPPGIPSDGRDPP